jgi:hypothetical protein
VRELAPHAPPHGSAPAHAAREPWGVPLVTALQTPGAPLTSHASHWPAHASLQHKPSTQCPLWHAELAEQALAFGAWLEQLPDTQNGAAELQSALPVQLVKQAVPALLQAKLPGQLLVLTAGHWPAPLHAAAAVSFEPWQLCGRHEVLLPGNVQLVREPVLHAPAQLPAPPQAARPPRGCPLVSGEHVPGFAGRSQASHCPSQAASQHTPSTHLVLVQSLLAAHAVPFGFAPQEPATHGFDAAHGTVAEQLVLQAPPLASHVYGVQGIALGATH